MFIANYTNKESIKKLHDVNIILESWTEFEKNFSTIPNPEQFPKYRANDIIDEDKSVKWNREEVKRRIDNRNAESTRLRTTKNEISHLYENVLIRELAKDYEISEMETKIIWRKAYEDSHAYSIASVYNTFAELADMYEDLRKAVRNQ